MGNKRKTRQWHLGKGQYRWPIALKKIASVIHHQGNTTNKHNELLLTSIRVARIKGADWNKHWWETTESPTPYAANVKSDRSFWRWSRNSLNSKGRSTLCAYNSTLIYLLKRCEKGVIKIIQWVITWVWLPSIHGELGHGFPQLFTPLCWWTEIGNLLGLACHPPSSRFSGKLSQWTRKW